MELDKDNGNNIFILAPSFSGRAALLNAVYSLQFLPEYYNLILAGRSGSDPSFLAELTDILVRDELASRVQIVEEAPKVHVVILPNPGLEKMSSTVAGDSPEALASAILQVLRNRL